MVKPSADAMFRKPKNRELPPDNDHHHPWRYKGMSARIVHTYQRNKGRRNQQLVRNRIQQNSQGRHLPVFASRNYPSAPIGGRRSQQDQHAPDLKVHGKSPTARRWGSLVKQHHNQHWNEEDSAGPVREFGRFIVGRCRKARFSVPFGPTSATIDSAQGCVKRAANSTCFPGGWAVLSYN